jgi:hypothetical protein
MAKEKVTEKKPNVKEKRDDVKEFFDQVDKDKKLQRELKKNFSDVVTLGKKHGFTFTHKQMLEHLQKRWKITKAPPYDVDTCTG